MRIYAPPPARPIDASRKTGTTSTAASSFSTLLTPDSASETAATGASAPSGMIAGLIAVQAEEDASARKSRGLAHGRDLLDELEQLHRALVLGGIPLHRLKTLQHRLAQRPADTPADLAALLDEVELRVEVELAKAEMAAKA